jgi:hypothetical protein
VLCRRTNPALATTGATSAARPGETHLHGRSINRRCSCRARCFRCAALLGGLDNQRRGCFDTRADTRTPGPATIERAPCRSNASHQDGTARRGRDRASISRSAGRSVVELALYTVEGRQAGDLRQRCGTALIRKAKLPARSCERSSLLQGWLTRRIERVRHHKGGGSCVASWWSMTTGTPALP